jgi:DNA repair exonuclease SbcCD ATPase subunit
MVVDGNRKQEFDQDSGAGKGLIALATRIAMSRFLGARVLMLDEVSGAFDAYHLDLFIRLLHKLPELGFTQVFVISHQREVDESMQNQVVVTRYQEHGYSDLRLLH